MSGNWLITVASLLPAAPLAAAGPDDFPPSTAVPKITVAVGETVTVGGPLSDNFLPDTRMTVYLVPHRVWRDGDALGTDAVRKVPIRSDAKGKLPRTPVWKADKAGQFDIIVDYDGDGRFSFALDSLDGVIVRKNRDE